MDVIDVVISCALCDQPMAKADAPNDECGKHCPKSGHLHVRCTRCSPAGWYAVAKLAAETQA